MYCHNYLLSLDNREGALEGLDVLYLLNHLCLGEAIRCGPLACDIFRRPTSRLCSNSVVLSIDVCPADQGRALAKEDMHHKNSSNDSLD